MKSKSKAICLPKTGFGKYSGQELRKLPAAYFQSLVVTNRLPEELRVPAYRAFDTSIPPERVKPIYLKLLRKFKNDKYAMGAVHDFYEELKKAIKIRRLNPKKSLLKEKKTALTTRKVRK